MWARSFVKGSPDDTNDDTPPARSYSGVCRTIAANRPDRLAALVEDCGAGRLDLRRHRRRAHVFFGQAAVYGVLVAGDSGTGGIAVAQSRLRIAQRSAPRRRQSVRIDQKSA